MGRLGFRGCPARKVSLLSLPEKSRFVVAEESRSSSPHAGFWKSLSGSLPQGTGQGTPSELGFPSPRMCTPSQPSFLPRPGQAVREGAGGYFWFQRASKRFTSVGKPALW